MRRRTIGRRFRRPRHHRARNHRAGLRECGWNRTRAAKRLGLTRTQLYLRLQEYGIEKPSSGRKPVTRLIAAEVGLDPGGFRVSEC
jgi:DNA-binding NtrC family response regulator